MSRKDKIEQQQQLVNYLKADAARAKQAATETIETVQDAQHELKQALQKSEMTNKIYKGALYTLRKLKQDEN